MMSCIGNFVIPVVVAAIIIAGLTKGQNVFALFLDGAREGIPTAISILPALVALTTAIAMLRASGAFGIISSAVAPFFAALRVPPQVLPLALMRPVSGSGSLSLLESILRENGPDSFAGRVACVMQGSTETTFYTVTVYYGAVGVSKTRHTLPAALCADFIGFVMSVFTVNLLMR